MKIKTKKQLNLPQLIEWLLKSGYRNYTANSNMGNIVTLSRYGAIQFSLGTFFPEDTFTVEVEEEITEDKWFPELVIRTVAGDYRLHKQGSINDFKRSTFNDVEAFYIPNGDLTLTLIWTHEKGLVE
ncbi:MAG: hypothetical protein ACTIDZ_03760 [Staphylococcus sp.]|uniref:hypothetical protein n=1 Tax=Staphylococcus sp. TaxID=29387 RepID=UPI003F9C8782